MISTLKKKITINIRKSPVISKRHWINERPLYFCPCMRGFFERQTKCFRRQM